MTVLRTRTSSTARSRRTVAAMSAATLSLAAAASFGIAPLLSPASATPHSSSHRVVVCHWVPAHGGSYVRIVIDDDGLSGHGGHEHDVIGPLDDTEFACETPTPEVTPTEDPTPEVTPTEEPTPEVTPTEEPTPEVTPTEEPTPEVTPTDEPTPEVTPTEDPTPEVTPTEDPAPEVTPTEEPTPVSHRVIVCHWVPAHEGSFVRIEIDQNGLSGHSRHEHDRVGPVDDLTFSCDTEVDPIPVTPTEPTDPTEPTVPTEPTEPTEPSTPSAPEDSSDNASGTVTVDDLASSSAVPTQLAHTGTQASSIALVGAGLLAAGVFVLVAGRKRREV